MYRRIEILFFIILSFSFCCLAEILDDFDNDVYLTETLNSSVTANGNSTVSMTVAATGDCVVDWRKTYIRLSNINDRIEITPTSSISGGQYSLYILYFTSSKSFLGEVQWQSQTSNADVKVLESAATLAAQNGISNPYYYYIRFRLHGGIGSGFIFDKAHAKMGPGYWTPTALTTAAPKAAFGHEMTGWRTPYYSGTWSGWNAYGHNPAVLDANGKPEIASVYYPSVGYYDMKDPKLVEYHCQCMKMACMDGAIFDLGFYDMDIDSANMMSNYLSIMADYNLQAVICYEDKVHWLWDSSATTRAIALQRAYEDMNNWLNLFISSGRQYNVSGTRPLFLMFSYEVYTGSAKGYSCLSPSEITAWLDTFSTENRPVILRQWFKVPDHFGVLNGMFGWPELPLDNSVPPYIAYCDMDDNNDTLYGDRDFGQSLFSSGYGDFHIPGTWPGFDDLEVNGWGSGARLMPRYDGLLYDTTWQWAIEDNLPVVQIATWNDWYEGTVIEPAVEFGGQYLQITADRASEFKGLTNFIPGDFNVPVWIYRLRDVTDDSLILNDMNTAGDLIKAGLFDQARDIVQPWAQHFNIDSVAYWTGPGSMITEPNIQTPAIVDFGNVPLGASGGNSVNIFNAGTETLEFIGGNPIYILAGTSDYSIIPLLSTDTLSPAQNNQVMIKFQPSQLGTRTGVLRIYSNDADQPVLNVSLTGTASQAGDYYPDNEINFKDFAVIASDWQGEYSFEDLELIAENWLNQ